MKGWEENIEILRNTLRRVDPLYEELQVKVKFGGLRYYFKVSDELDLETEEGLGRYAIMDKVVHVTETVCENTCIVCGSHAKIGKDKYNTPHCEEHL